MVLDQNINQYIHTDTIQWSWGLGRWDLLSFYSHTKLRTNLFVLLFLLVLAVQAKARITGSSSQVSQFNIWVRQQLHTASKGVNNAIVFKSFFFSLLENVHAIKY